MSVSVIVPCYRAAATVSRAVASALAQRGVDVEVILVDDASPDDTPAVLATLAAQDGRVRVVRLPVNGGPSRARNAGIDHAGGDWLAFLDADDAMAPTRLRRLLDAAAATGVTMIADTQFLCAGADAAPHAVRLAGVVAPGGCGIVTPETFIRRNLAVAKPLVARERLARTGVRFDESLRCGEDFRFILALMLRGGELALLDEPLYAKHQLPTSITGGDRGGALGAMRDVLQATAQAIRQGQPPLAAAGRDALLSALSEALQAQDDALAFEAWRGALRSRRLPAPGSLWAALRHLRLRRARFPKRALTAAAAARAQRIMERGDA